MSTALGIEAHGPFDHRAALATLAAHAVDGLERVAPAAGRSPAWRPSPEPQRRS